MPLADMELLLFFFLLCFVFSFHPVCRDFFSVVEGEKKIQFKHSECNLLYNKNGAEIIQSILAKTSNLNAKKVITTIQIMINLQRLNALLSLMRIFFSFPYASHELMKVTCLRVQLTSYE